MLARLGLVGAVIASLLTFSTVASPTPAGAGTALPPVRHVFTIVLENEEFALTWTLGLIQAPYLTRTLALQGAFVPDYFATGHSSLDNYIAMTSGQGPNPDTQGDCHDPSTLGGTRGAHIAGFGQAVGALGCTYPAQVQSIGTQLTANGDTWKGYMQDMDAEPGVYRTTCRGPATEKIIENPVPVGHPKSPDDYKDKHNPFVYYHSVFDNLAYCDAHDVPFTQFTSDLKSIATTPNYSFITPNQCNDGHDMPTCSDGSTGGAPRYDAFLRTYVPLIEASPAYKKDGLIVIVFDEGILGTACCGEVNSPMVGSGTNSGFPLPGFLGSGGGQTGAVLLSRFIKPGTLTLTPYNHYSYLRSMEDLFHLPHLGYAQQPSVTSFGADVFTNG
jgi:hypothetical protein